MRTFIIEPSLKKVVLPVDNEAIPICTHTVHTLTPLIRSHLANFLQQLFCFFVLFSYNPFLILSRFPHFIFRRFSQTVIIIKQMSLRI